MYDIWPSTLWSNKKYGSYYFPKIYVLFWTFCKLQMYLCLWKLYYHRHFGFRKGLHFVCCLILRNLFDYNLLLICASFAFWINAWQWIQFIVNSRDIFLQLAKKSCHTKKRYKIELRSQSCFIIFKLQELPISSVIGFKIC